MPQTRGQFFDDISRLVTDAAGLADSARREVETLARAQMERVLSAMNVVSREEFEAVREMAVKARDENEKLRGPRYRAGGKIIWRRFTGESRTRLIRLGDSVDEDCLRTSRTATNLKGRAGLRGSQNGG